MSNKKLQNVGGINLKLRLKNPQFLIRAVISVVLPALAYIGISQEEALSSWSALGDVTLDILSSPMALGIILINILNIIPDPTRASLTDSERVKQRESAFTSNNKPVYPVDEQYQYNKPEETNEQTVDTTDEYQAPEDKVFPTAEELENNLEDNSDDFKDISFKK